MSNTFLGLRTVIYKVSDLAKATAWYASAFGTEPYFNEPFYVGFSIGGYELGLLPEETSEEIKTANVLTYWGVDHVDQEYKRLLDAGATALEEPHDVGGEIIVAAVKDPWGNAIGLIYNPHFRLEE